METAQRAVLENALSAPHGEGGGVEEETRVVVVF